MTGLVLLHEFEWFIDTALMLVLLVAADRLLGVSPVKFITTLLREVQELVRGESTVGAINALALAFVFILGVIALSGAESSILQFAAGLLEHQKVREYADSVSGLALIAALIFLASISMFFVLLSERARR